MTTSDEIKGGAAPTEGLSAPRTARGSDLPRYEGKPAEIAHLSALVEDAAQAGDTTRERDACVRLARALTQRGTDLEAAIGLARRALALGDDPGLRGELAGWLAGLGETFAAAQELRAAIRPSEKNRARALIRAGVLFARAAKPGTAALLFAEASEVEPSDPIAEELVGTLSAWAEDVLPKRQGAQAFAEAARRRKAQGNGEAAFEDLLRALELCPSDTAAVEAVVRALEEQGRFAAADEILRDHAGALEAQEQVERALRVHETRIAQALDQGDTARALGAVLDLVDVGGFARPELDARVDEALARAGLSELLAARLERRARRFSGTLAAEAYEALARLYTGALGSEERATFAWVEAAVADPERGSALDALREVARQSSDKEPLTEALIRIALGERSSVSAARLAFELSDLATDSGDPALAEWALSRAAKLDEGQYEEAELRKSRLEPLLAERDAEISRAEALGEGEGGGAREVRLEAKRKLVRLYGKSPAFEERAASVLATFLKAEPLEPTAARSLRWLMRRETRDDTRLMLFESVLRVQVDARLSRRELCRVRSDLAAIVGADGSSRRPLDELAPLLEQEPDAYAASLVLEQALRGHHPVEQAKALEALAAGFDPKLAAVLLSAAADAHRRAGALVDARRTAERALDLDPSSARAASGAARVAAVSGGRDAALSIERALGVVVPRAWLCDALARSLESIDEPDLAFAWTQRWLALAPGDRRAITEFLRRCQLGTDPARIADALTWVLAQPDPPDERLTLFLDALTLLFGLDPGLGGQVARRALDVFGPKHYELRERLGALADEHHDAGLSIALLERVLASDPDVPKDTLIELSQRRMAVGDFDSAARELLRAFDSSVDLAAVHEAMIDLEKDAGSSGLSSDGVVALFELRARLFSAVLADPELRAQLPKVDVTLVETAWRALGATRWDLAKDPRGSEQALLAASEVSQLAGYDLYAHDLAELAGPERAAAAIMERLSLSTELAAPRRVRMALACAQMAAENGLAAYALDAALAALEVEPANTEAIAMVEAQAAHVDGGVAAVDHMYDALAAAAMGIFGRRAAHYRAARQLERLGDRDLALRHALAAFEAVPNEGTSWVLLTRLVDPAQGSPDAVALFRRVAAKAPQEERASWFRRALELSGTDHAGMTRRFDILLSALSTAPEASFAVALAETIANLASDGGMPEGAAPRLAAVADALLPGLEGPDGARTSAQLSRVLVSVGVEDQAFAALRKAIEIDGELEVFDRIAPSAPAFAAFVESATDLVAWVEARMADKMALVGPPLLRFAAAVADGLLDSRASSTLLAEAERRGGGLGEEEGGRPSIHEDPFADAAMFDSAPAPAPTADAAPAASPEPTASPPQEPSPPPHEPGPADLVIALSEPPTDGAPTPTTPARGLRAIPGARRSSSSATLSPVKDGFDALFDDDGHPTTAPVVDELEAREAEARDRGDHQAVSDLLEQRIHQSTWGDQVRVLKLRRAAVLEQRLDRSAEAQKELEEVLADNPTDRSALAFLADLLGRRGAPAQAAPLYERLTELPELESDDKKRFALSAARAHLDAGELDQALRVLDALPAETVDRQVHEFRLVVVRKKGDLFSLVMCIDQFLAAIEVPDAEAAGFLVEACRAAAALGDEQGALIRARRAMRLAPDSPDASLECARLEYRARGMGTPREAQAVVETLNALHASLEPEHIELHTFLLAEALDVIQGGGAGLREMTHRHAEVGPLPLIALGMAERLSRQRSFEAAVPLFEIALEGDLRGLRNKARVALGAAEAAIHAGQADAARVFLQIAERAPETRPQIARKRRELLALDEDPAVAEPVLRELVKESGGISKARYLQQLARLVGRDRFEESMALFEEALVLARRDRPLADKIRAELIELIEAKGISRAETVPAPDSGARSDPPSAPPSSAAVASSQRPDSAARPALNPPNLEAVEPEAPAPLPEHEIEPAPHTAPSAALVEAVRPPPLPPPLPVPVPKAASEPVAEAQPISEEPPSIRVEPISQGSLGADLPSSSRRQVAPISVPPGSRPLLSGSEQESLYAELMAGFVDAGDALVRVYELSGKPRSREVLMVRRHQAALLPGDRAALLALRDAAAADRDEVYVRAIEHVLGVETDSASSPPPLFAQPREPDLLSALLFRDLGIRETEVLALVWEAGMFRKELGSYGLSGADRVPLTVASVVGEAYSEIAAHLAAPRPVFHKRAEGPPELSVAMLAQPALLVTGEVRQKAPDLVYGLAAMHASAAPELVLAAHLPEPLLRRLFEALSAAFGPVRPRGDDAPPSSTDAFRADVARIATELWQRVNPRAERRLRELCEGEPLRAERAREVALRAMRRAGLFACGDLALALGALASEAGQPGLAGVGDGALAAAASASEDVCDLVRLAIRAEYAEARWQLPAPGSVRRG